MRLPIIAVVLALASTAAAAPHYRGAKVRLDVKQAELKDVLRLLADVGRFNVVLVDVPRTKLDVTAADEPWDKVLDDVIARSNLAYQHTGLLYVVGAPGLIAARKKQPARKPSGVRLDLDVVDVDAANAAKLVAAGTGKPFEIAPGAPRHVSLTLRRLALSQVWEMIALQAGGAVVAHPAGPMKPDAACAARAVASTTLRLAGVVAVGTRRAALLTDGARGSYVVVRDGCVGSDKRTVKELGPGYLTLVDPATNQKSELRVHPVEQ